MIAAMQRCYIVGAAPDAERIAPQAGDFIIAADGGLDHLASWGLAPNLIVGDMDSAKSAPQGVEVKRFSPAKDDTDVSLALCEGLARGYQHIILTGAWGGRADHSLGNLQLLVKTVRLGRRAYLLCGGMTATALTDHGVLQLKGKGTVSVFACGGHAQGVTIRGMEYALDSAALRDDNPIGISNALDGAGAVTLEHGTLLVFWDQGITDDMLER